MSSDACGRAALIRSTSLAASSGRVGVADPHVEIRRVLRVRQEHLLELGKRLRPAADALERRDLTVVEVEDRLHAQELPRQPRSLSDAPAANQVLESLDREEQAPGLLEALDDGQEFLLRRSSVEPPLQRVGEDDRTAADHARVHERHPPSPLDSAPSRALSNVPESRAESSTASTFS